ncbi:hypothetical protein Poly41_08820 [Novipirellula artificiosorum]|uniref:Uncharacterized protein n=1 Tax=Novipirellula artificiosorum TaxID=2528016 RepID=A0A5C6E276_9BACT|nr:hypothetical protein Poly41_08820 [Novipirellula artificiosorum]
MMNQPEVESGQYNAGWRSLGAGMGVAVGESLMTPVAPRSRAKVFGRGIPLFSNGLCTSFLASLLGI